MERVGPFEKKRFSYWRTEERRRVLALSGWESLQTSTTRELTKKIVHLLGQNEHSSLKETVFKDLVLVRQYVREVSLTKAGKDQDFWLSYGQWRVEHYPCPTVSEWQTLVQNDHVIYK